MWLIIAALAIVPVAGSKIGLLSNFMVLQLSLMIVFAIAVLGLNLLTGFNGQISLGHGAFFALGAYTAAVLIDRYDFPWWSTVPIAALLSCASNVITHPLTSQSASRRRGYCFLSLLEVPAAPRGATARSC